MDSLGVSPWIFQYIGKQGRKDQRNEVGKRRPVIGNGPNTVSESTVSNTELSEFFGAH